VSTAHDNVDHDALAGMVGIMIDARGVCADADNVVRS